MILQTIALFSCGTFFGAALYISIAQHPATIETGADFGTRFFPPMYSRAAPLQIVLALFGFIAGSIVWYQSSELLWLVGSLLLVSVIPITLILIKPINDILLNSEKAIEANEASDLLVRWGPKHWLRTIASGCSFLVFLFAALNA